MPVWTVIYTLAFPPLAALILLAAWRWGGRVELIVSLIYVAGTDLQLYPGTHYVGFQPIVAFVDWSIFCLVAALAIREPLAWLRMSAALLLLGALAHVARLFDAKLSNLAYAILMGSTGYPALVLLMIGIVTHNRRTHRRTPRF